MAVVNEGTDAILRHLRNRLPTPQKQKQPRATQVENAENEAPKNQQTMNSPQSHALKAQTAADDQASAPSSLRTPVAKNLFGSAPMRSSNQAARSPEAKSVQPALSATLMQFEDRIASLERQLDAYGITKAKQFALKKELAMVRAQKIRETRRLSQQQ